MQDLTAKLNALCDEHPFTTTWYFKDLKSGFTADRNGDQVVPSASTRKISIMMAALAACHAGNLNLDDPFTIDKEYQDTDSGTFQFLTPGFAITFRDALVMMIIVSDNTATEVLFRMVGGPDAVNARMQALGLKTTRAMNVPSQWFPALRSAPTTEQFYREGKSPFGYSTAREMGRLLELMERGTLVDKPSSDLMLRIMRGQLYRTRIPRYVTGFTIPHKTGDFLPYVGDDVGVLEAPGKTIVISIFTGNHFGSGELLENAIGLVARDVADYFAYRP